MDWKKIFGKPKYRKYITLAERKKRREREMLIVNVTGIVLIAVMLVVGVTLLIG